MVTVYDQGMYLVDGKELVEAGPQGRGRLAERFGEAGVTAAKDGAIAASILKAHSRPSADGQLHLRFDAMASHDITFVGIVQTAKVSGLREFPVPYVLTNCHNSLCAVGGTINEDDHMFGLSAAQKYGGVYVPPHQAVIHSYVREMLAGGGKMILGSDSHTRYGALGAMGVGEGGGELVKQLLRQTYDMPMPKVLGVYLTGKPQPGVGPQDVALAIIGASFKNGLAKNRVMEFVGDGIGQLSVEYRNGIDVMTTETTCWSSIWQTDDAVRRYLECHGRGGEYKPLAPRPLAYYDGFLHVDLSAVRPMIALPFHPSNTYEIETLNQNLGDILHSVEKEARDIIQGSNSPFRLTDKIQGGSLRVDQGVIAGCAGGIYDNLMMAASILRGRSIGDGTFSLSVYPASQPVMLEITKNGAAADLLSAGAVLRTAFCGPCFGAGDVPANNALSIRHTTRNFPNREGSRPMNGQMAGVALMDARSIAATALHGGILTPATQLDMEEKVPPYHFDDAPYRHRVYNGFGKARPEVPLHYGPGIADWPEMEPLGQHLLVKVVTHITDPVTTTDEIIPSGETSSYRSNPLGLAEFTFSRKDPAYVGKAKEVQAAEKARLASGGEEGAVHGALPELAQALAAIRSIPGHSALGWDSIQIGSAIYANKPGDGSAREQAASCQRVLGGSANFALEYATKRYRSNVMNWGMLPFLVKDASLVENGDYVFIPWVREGLAGGESSFRGYVLGPQAARDIDLHLQDLTRTEREIILAGCLINYNRRLSEV